MIRFATWTIRKIDVLIRIKFIFKQIGGNTEQQDNRIHIMIKCVYCFYCRRFKATEVEIITKLQKMYTNYAFKTFTMF